MRLHKPGHTTVVAYAALFFAMGGTAAAATGGTFLLGKSNSATTTTVLTNGSGVALTLNSKAGTAPFTTNSTTRVGHLNADLLDGLDSAALQRRVSTSCPDTQAIRGINANGTVTCDPGLTGVRVAGGTIDTSGDYAGVGGARCPVGYAVVGGGFDTDDYDPSTHTQPSLVTTAIPITTSNGEAYVVALVNPADGSPFLGGGWVYATCVPGASSNYTPAARYNAVTSAGSAEDRRATYFRNYLASKQR